MLNVITSSKSFLTWKITYLQVSGFGHRYFGVSFCLPQFPEGRILWASPVGCMSHTQGLCTCGPACPGHCFITSCLTLLAHHHHHQGYSTNPAGNDTRIACWQRSLESLIRTVPDFFNTEWNTECRQNWTELRADRWSPLHPFTPFHPDLTSMQQQWQQKALCFHLRWCNFPHTNEGFCPFLKSPISHCICIECYFLFWFSSSLTWLVCNLKSKPKSKTTPGVKLKTLFI